jgi:hypothetical protein
MLEALFGLVAFVVLLALGAGITLIALRARNGESAPTGRWPFSLRQPLTEPEQVLYHRLCHALPDHMVLAQVAVSRFLAVRRGHDARAWYNRINRMSVDFLICTPDATVVAAIELDDATHRQPERVAADAKKELALKAAGVRVLRWNVAALPDAAAIQAAFAATIAPRGRRSAGIEGPDTGSFRTA